MRRELSLDEMKEIELNLLIEFKNICNKLGLRYYLSGGTLLGAIRHKGFIPWDDDIDLCMPRPDYNKLIEFSKTYKSKTNKFIFFNEENELLPYSKFVNIKTELDSKFMHDEMHKHIWIDIMPMDGLPENLDELEKIYKKAHFYRKTFSLCGARLGEGKNLFRKVIKYIAKPTVSLFYGKGSAIKKLNKLSTKYNYDNSKYVGAVSWGLYGVSERMLKSDIGMGCEVEFENEKFNTFCCWDSYLTSLYGDYMQLPPIEKRKTHNIVVYMKEENI